VKIGVLLPIFQINADAALTLAERAERAGLDGVFAFDHLWPIGSPERPALAPMPVLAAVAARFSLGVGTLVARVGLVSGVKLVEQFTTLEAMAPGRVIAGLGTGDDLSKDEHDAYGINYPSASERRRLLSDAVMALAPLMNVWCGAGSPLTNAVAREHGVALNLWGVPAQMVREEAVNGPVTWAGPLAREATTTLSALDDAGATWAVISVPAPLDELKEWRRSH
jgi:alkanesulfonate monooxygenase SsuD/methylene tetrahydromethanopterin reductase-like flavin-dependent oxidoreductase (luciferase family)